MGPTALDLPYRRIGVRAAPIAFLPAPGYRIVANILREGTASLF